MRIKSGSSFLAVALIGALFVSGTVAYRGINEIKMGGPIQQRDRAAADLIADVLPPPEYVIEAYLDASRIMIDPSETSDKSKQLTTLKHDYESRHDYWTKSTLPADVRDPLTVGAHQSAVAFWKEMDTAFLPAAKSGDRARTAASYARLTSFYLQHRRHIDTVVQRATAYQKSVSDYAQDRVATTVLTLSVSGVFIILLIVACCWLFVGRVLNPLRKVVGAMEAMAVGNYDIAIPHGDRQDELGDAARALTKFREGAMERRQLRETIEATAQQQEQLVSLLDSALHRVAGGDLTTTIEKVPAAEYEKLRLSFNKATSELCDLIGSVTEAARSIKIGSHEIAQASEDLARRTEGNAASLEETSAAIQQIDGRLKATVIAAERSVAGSAQTMAAVGDGRLRTDQAVQAMGRVSDSAKGIDGVIEGLDKIAFQTRVLAMNAAVEAGRAGDAGRGFAVVADLVSALAMRAEEEAKRARDQLTVTQTEIGYAVEAVQKVDGALADISTAGQEAASLAEQIASDNQAQASAITEVSAAISTMDRSTQQNAAMVEQTSAAARNLTSEVNGLSDRANHFTVGNVSTRSGFKSRNDRAASNPEAYTRSYAVPR